MIISEKHENKVFNQTFERFCWNAKIKLLKVRLLFFIIFYIIMVMIPLNFLGYKLQPYKLSNPFQIIIVLLYFTFYYLCYLLFKDSSFGAIIYLKYCKCIDFLFFLIYTRKGEAIKTSDFKEIKLNNKELYNDISTDECQGQCYTTCFDILKTLKKGKIIFLVTGVHYYDNPSMHVLYVNNGWCFDTNFRMQFEYMKVLGEYDVCIFKQFDYEEVKGLSFEEFRCMHKKEIEEWCNKNNYFSFSRI